MMRNFLDGIVDLMLNSLSDNSAKVVLESALETFSEFLNNNGKSEAKNILMDLSSSTKTSKENSCKLLIKVNNDVKNFSYNHMKRLLNANYKIFYSMAFAKLFESIFKQKNDNQEMSEALDFD